MTRATPDGSHLLLHHIDYSTAPTLNRQLAYHPVDDFHKRPLAIPEGKG